MKCLKFGIFYTKFSKFYSIFPPIKSSQLTSASPRQFVTRHTICAPTPVAWKTLVVPLVDLAFDRLSIDSHCELLLTSLTIKVFVISRHTRWASPILFHWAIFWAVINWRRVKFWTIICSFESIALIAEWECFFARTTSIKCVNLIVWAGLLILTWGFKIIFLFRDFGRVFTNGSYQNDRNNEHDK